MIEPSAAAIPWMFATGNHEPELFSSRVAADHVTVANYEPIGYGGHSKRLPLRQRRQCAFSTCASHSSDGGVRATLAPLFTRYQVDLAVQGHPGPVAGNL